MDVDQLKSQAMAAWKQTYMAALFEIDKNKLNERITDAERAVAERTRELFQTDSDISTRTQLRERKALEAALYALRALRGIAESQRSSVAEKRPFAA